MEGIKNFFTKDNALFLYTRFYDWLESLLVDVFGNFSYAPMRTLLVNPLFWIIILVLIFLGLLFRRR